MKILLIFGEALLWLALIPVPFYYIAVISAILGD